MNRGIFFFIFLFISIEIQAQYESDNISFLNNFDDSTIVPTNSLTSYSSVFGYYDSIKKREYAIIGAASGTYIIEVTNPLNIIERAFIPGRRDRCSWREYRTYKNFLYAVSDDTSPNSLQIIDLSPDAGPQLVYDSDTLFMRAHTVFVDGNKLYTGSVTTNDNLNQSMGVYSLENPLSPKLLRYLGDDFPDITTVHDMFVRNDTVYASCGFQGLHVYKLNSNNSFTELGSMESPDGGYNHSSTLSPDGKTLIVCEEIPAGQDVKILDLSDLTDIKIITTFYSHPDATPHNPYFLDNDKVVIAYYMDGVQVFNVKDRLGPKKIAFFDSYPDNQSSYVGRAYIGCWGAYPYLPSRNLLISDMQRGLFVLKPDYSASSIYPWKEDNKLFPMPFNNIFSVNFESPVSEPALIEIFDLNAERVLKADYLVTAGKNIIEIDASKINQGLYLLTLNSQNFTKRWKILKAGTGIK